MTWLDPPPLVEKPRPPSVKLPPEVRPRNVVIMIASTTLFFAAIAFGFGFLLFVGLEMLRLPARPIRSSALTLLALLGGIVGYVSGWRVIQTVITEKISKDHD